MLLTLLVILTIAALYWFPIRRWMNQWGAAPSDLAREMAGDSLLADPTYSGTMAVIVNARPEHIWPWLVQIGYQRGGLYSYDWLDRLFGYLDRPSATRILPEFQHLAIGDAIPLGRGPSWPVALVEPNRALVLDMRNMGGLDTVKNSPVMVRSVVAAAQRAGVPCRVKAAVVGEANDAGSFSLAGLKATTLIPFKMPQQMVALYHQKWDTPEALTIAFNVSKVALEWIRLGGE